MEKGSSQMFRNIARDYVLSLRSSGNPDSEIRKAIEYDLQYVYNLLRVSYSDDIRASQ